MSLPPGASDARSVGGGDINEAYRVRLADGREAFVKTRAQPVPGEYAAEANGLAWLSEPGHLRTPAVYEQQEEYLALEWIERGGLSPEGAEELGRGLAETHRAGAEHFGAPPGAPAQTGFGSLRLANEPAPGLALVLRGPAAPPAARARARARRDLRGGSTRRRAGLRADRRALRPARAAREAPRRPLVGERDGGVRRCAPG